MTLDQLTALIQELTHRDYTVIGPRRRDGAIVYDEINSVDELPAGWTEEQSPGNYRLSRRDDMALFGFTVGPHTWKKYLFPPEQTLYSINKRDTGIEFIEHKDDSRFAFLGVRSCEIHAIEIQDKVFLKGSYQDSHYKKRRENSFIIAVNCSTAASTCFCTSMNTGPKADRGFDLALTELLDKDAHYFIVETGSERGESIIKTLGLDPANEQHKALTRQHTERTVSEVTKVLDTKNIQDLFAKTMEHPRWDDVASRCTSCTNCTMVCPTCFCSSVEDEISIDGNSSKRTRTWDSCFTLDFSYIHGGSVRQSTKSRYRQWLNHKLSTWIDQFGTSGCVGCGRCISWCPAGIDLTVEVQALREESLEDKHEKDH